MKARPTSGRRAGRWLRTVVPVLFVVPALATTPLIGATTAHAATPPNIMLIVEENQGFSQVIGNTKSAPYTNRLATTYASATNWFGLTDTSLADYVALISGTTASYKSPTVVNELAAVSTSWKAYMEDAPSVCYTGGSTGHYTKTHNPFVHFKSITSKPALCDRVVPFAGNFATDFSPTSTTAPSFAYVVPNQCNDMHDSCAPLKNPVKQGDQWLQSTMSAVLASPWYSSGGIVIITWDSALTSDHSHWNTGTGGHVPTIVVSATSHGPFASGGNHYGTLRAIEEAYGVTLLGASAAPANGDLTPAL
ncbi:MAG: alkaline phosphatase family protein [Candidatus Dormibacteraeota bacterium]|nr:alkaline phosphatase family protein [Candidatus Dormibacteraeota bacterium]